MNIPARAGQWTTLLLMLLICSTWSLYAQPGTTIHLKDEKPAEFAKKLLRAEKTDYGPLGKFQQFMQNTFTRFNYLYNANKRMEDILNKATATYKEDYARLLSYYPYDAKAMAGNAYLDSVIQHATAGILLHDLRNQYVDELYFLLGKAYYYQQKYDTAHQVFQYLNYAFAPKDDGYDLPIGSNISKVKGHFTILNPEHKGISKNSYARKERRNDGLLWQIKNFIQSGDYIQARVLLGYIEKDSLLPGRLKPAVAQTHGLLFYRLKKYDSAAAYLRQSGYTVYKKTVRPRMYYLTGQLYALGGDSLSAATYYAKAKSSATDPLLSIYAALAEASMKNTQGIVVAETGQKSDQDPHMVLLRKLARRDKYKRFKDVIYFAEAAIALNKGQRKTGRALLLSSIETGKKITPPNDWQKSRTYFTLAGLEYDENNFYDASRFYDSVKSADLTGEADRALLTLRQSPLNNVAVQLDSVYYQDSLQHLAGLPEKERINILKEKAREIRKAIQRDREAQGGNVTNPAIRRPVTPTSLFPSLTSGSTIWYFNNPTLKNSGYQLFKQKFGNRPNVDNWQRLSAINGAANGPSKASNNQSILDAFNEDGSLKLDSSNIQPEDLLKGLPLTKGALDSSNNKIASRLFTAGKILQNSMENYTGALFLYDSLLHRFNGWDSTDAVLFNQYICWILLGKRDKANLVLSSLEHRYKNSPWLNKIRRQDSLKNSIQETSLRNQATYAYNEVYQFFVEGAFRKADSLKQIADKKYGSYYWTPQLLYIESVYHISESRDSVAITKLNYLIQHFTSSPIKSQAQHLLSILKRRSEIEAYLRQLKISPSGYIQNDRLARLETAAIALADQRERRIGLLRGQKILDLTDSSSGVISQLSGSINDKSSLINLKRPDTMVMTGIPSNNIVQPPIQVTDSLKTRTPVTELPSGQILKKADASQSHPIAVTPSTRDQKKTRPEKVTDSTQIDHVAQAGAIKKPPTTGAPAMPPSTPVKQSATIGGFIFNPSAPQYVTVTLHKVAPVFASEAANAFNRYNLLAFEHEKWPVNRQGLEDYDMVQIGPFRDYAAAKSYLKQIQEVTPSTILPWLTQDKYEFIIVSPQNMNKLKSGEDLINYRAAWKQFESK